MFGNKFCIFRLACRLAPGCPAQLDRFTTIVVILCLIVVGHQIDVGDGAERTLVRQLFCVLYSRRPLVERHIADVARLDDAAQIGCQLAGRALLHPRADSKLIRCVIIVFIFRIAFIDKLIGAKQLAVIGKGIGCINLRADPAKIVEIAVLIFIGVIGQPAVEIESAGKMVAIADK